MKSDKELEELFDLAREEMANSIGMKKEKLFVNIYGTDKQKDTIKGAIDGRT